jgi:hypothetical protein
MRDTIDMALEAGIIDPRDAFSEEHVQAVLQDLKAFEALVRADEREICTNAAMAASEEAVNFAMALEREACAELVFNSPPSDEYESPLKAVYNAIRARGNT